MVFLVFSFINQHQAEIILITCMIFVFIWLLLRMLKLY